MHSTTKAFFRLLKGSIVFLSSAFSANELHELNVYFSEPLCHFGSYPDVLLSTHNGCTSFSRNLVIWSNAVSTE